MTQYASVDEFIKKHLRTKQHWNKKLITMKDAIWQKLEEPTYLGNCTFAAGSTFKVFETQNFGWIVFDQNTKTVEGNTPNNRIFKW